MTTQKELPTTQAPTDDLAAYLFHQGTNYRSYEYLGAHRIGTQIIFRVWAPNADSVSVCGDFNAWEPNASPMTKITGGGVWEAVLPSASVLDGQNYKYRICTDNRVLFKADPYGVKMQAPPETASVICDIGGYIWRDESWMRYRRNKFDRQHLSAQPINIYEVHLGSWRRREDGSYRTYTEQAADLAEYVKQMGYTHVELMPLAEYPFDGSWGYQVCGYYAPTARYGEPKELMALIDTLHEAGIGVILDWVPAHFPKDAHGLYEFDGKPLYEYQGRDRMEHEGWGTRRFDVGREEVQSFLVSNAAFWIEKYHIDGLRVDAVASMLYLDYDKRPGEWVPNVYGENKCLEAIAFFQKLNSFLAGAYPDVMSIAEESTAWSRLTTFADGGLGFSLKWNMGWMNDSLAYVQEDPLWRSEHHTRMNFSITYSFGERYVLPISHDEVVHGKLSLLDRMRGDYQTKFAGTRTYLTYMMTHPGKKLLFMGCELGMFREWDYAGELEWFLLDYDMHSKLQLFTAELNHFYLQNAALWEMDDSWEHFQWIDADNAEQSIFSYRRIDKRGKELVVLLNFLPQKRENFLLAVPDDGIYEEVFNSDEERYGGSGCVNRGKYKTVPCMLRGYTRAVSITVPPMGALILQCKRKTKKAIKQQGNKQ